MDEYIESMTRAGVISESNVQSGWNSPVMLVAKNTPGKYRFVCDLRNLNKACIGDQYQLNNLNHALDRLAGNRLYSTFDFTNSFGQIEYDEDSKPLPAFLHNNKRYWFNRMIQGHLSSSSQFSRMMAKLLQNIPIHHLVYFIDDLLISSMTVTEHFEYLEIILSSIPA